MTVYCFKFTVFETHLQRVQSAYQQTPCAIVTIQLLWHIVTICEHDISRWAKNYLFVIGR